MSLLSGLFGSKTQGPSTTLRVACTFEGQRPRRELDPATRILVTDQPGLGAKHVQRVLSCVPGAPVLFLGPGLAPSGLQALQGTSSAAAKLGPGENLQDLVGAIAVATRGSAFVRELGAGDFPRREAAKSPGGILFPVSAWDTLTPEALGRAEHLEPQVGELAIRSPGKLAKDVGRHLELRKAWARSARTREEWKRSTRVLELFGVAADLPSAPELPEEAGLVPAGLASQFLITDVETGRAVLEDAHPCLLGFEANRLEVLLPLLEQAAGRSVPLLLVAPGFGDEVLAALVVNKLHGTLSLAAVALGAAADPLLAKVSEATGAKVFAREADVPSKPDLSRRVRAEIGLGHARLAAKR